MTGPDELAGLCPVFGNIKEGKGLTGPAQAEGLCLGPTEGCVFYRVAVQRRRRHTECLAFNAMLAVGVYEAADKSREPGTLKRRAPGENRDEEGGGRRIQVEP